MCRPEPVVSVDHNVTSVNQNVTSVNISDFTTMSQVSTYQIFVLQADTQHKPAISKTQNDSNIFFPTHDSQNVDT